MEECSREILTERTANDFSDDTLSVIRTVTAHMETLPVGTFKYKLFKYPGDIDIFEVLEECCTFNKAKLTAAQTIQSIVLDIRKNDGIIISEFKAGYDLRFKIYTGIITQEKGIDVLHDYNSQIIRRDIYNLYEAGILSCEELNLLFSLIKDNPEVNDVIKLNEELRKLWVIRWNSDEILTGYKLLRGNYKLYLDVALTQGSIVKLDTIAFINGRYTEVTNFFLIAQIDKYGNRKILSEELSDYGQSLLMDVYKYYGNNTLKAVKRLWMYLAFKGRICDLHIFKSLFSSDISLYSQIAADIEVAINLLRSNFNYNPKLLFDSMNERLKMLNGLCVNKPLYYDVSSNDFITISNNLEILYKCLQEEINNMTLNWLYDNYIDIFKLINSS